MTARLIRNITDTTHSHGGGALSDYLEAGRRAFAGDLYQLNYSYPPVFAMAMAPLGALPPRVAAGIWGVLQVAAVALCAYQLWKLLSTWARNSTGRPVPVVLVFGFALAVSFRFLHNNLTHGNINSFVLLCVLCAARALQESRAPGAGAHLAAAATMKFLPLFYLPILAVQRSMKSLLWMVVMLIVMNGALPLALAGPSRTATLSMEWYDKMIAPFYKQSTPGFDPRNLALSAAIQEHFLEVQPGEGGRESLQIATGNLALAMSSVLKSPAYLPRAFSQWWAAFVHVRRFQESLQFRWPIIARPWLDKFTKLVLGMIGLLTLYCAYRNRGTERAALLTPAAVLLCLLLVSPKTWTAHYAWILPAAAMLGSELLFHGKSWTPSRRAAAAVFVVTCLLFTCTSRGIIGTTAAVWIRGASLETAALLVWWLLLCIVALRTGDPGPAHNNSNTRAAPVPVD